MRRRGGACSARGGFVAATTANVTGGSERDDSSVRRRAILLLSGEAEAASVRGAGGEGGEEAGEGVLAAGARRLLQVSPGAEPGEPRRTLTQASPWIASLIWCSGLGAFKLHKSLQHFYLLKLMEA